MSLSLHCTSAFALLVLAIAASAQGANAQQQVQFRATMQTRESATAAPTSGTYYLGPSRTRMELTVDGQKMTIIADAAAQTQYILMPDEKMYMEMPIAMSPFPVPRAGTLDPANPCGSGGATECSRVGTETVNGYASTKWQYTLDGERWTSWIANQLRFPVRMVSESGSATEFTGIVQGNQPAELFNIPDGYTKMDMAMMAMISGGRGRGRGDAGRGNSGRGNTDAGRGNAGADAAMIAAMAARYGISVDPATAAAAAATANAAANDKPAGSGGWESGHGWIVNVTVTASGSETMPTATPARVTGTSSYSLKYVAAIPLNYGAPGIGTAQGPLWQTIVSLGTPEALAVPMTFNAEATYTSDTRSGAMCPVESATHTTVNTKGSVQARASIAQQDMNMAGVGLLKMSGDLRTFDLTVGIGAKGKAESQSVTEYSGCGSPPSTDRKTANSEPSFDIPTVEIKGLPLPAAPGPITGSRTMTLKMNILNLGMRDVQAQVQWNIVPIGGR